MIELNERMNDDPVASGAPPPSDQQGTDRCLNCNARRAGDYCYACGQHFLEGRLTLRRLGGEFAARFFKLERGLWVTLREMVTDPGGVARRYVKGQRQRYVNPLAYFLIAATLSLLTFSLYEQTITEALQETLLSVLSDNREAVAQPTAERALALATLSVKTIKRFNTYLLLLLCLPFALLLRGLISRDSRSYNLAETFVFSLYTIGQGTLLVALAAPLAVLLAPELYAALTIGVYLIICGHSALGFYGRRARAVALTLVAYLGAYLLYIGLLLMAFQLFRTVFSG